MSITRSSPHWWIRTGSCASSTSAGASIRRSASETCSRWSARHDRDDGLANAVGGAHPQRSRLVMRAAQQVTHLVGWIEWVVVWARGWRSGVPGARIAHVVPEAVLVEVLDLRRTSGELLGQGDGRVVHDPPQGKVRIGGDQIDPGPSLAKFVALVGGVERQVHPAGAMRSGVA